MQLMLHPLYDIIITWIFKEGERGKLPLVTGFSDFAEEMIRHRILHGTSNPKIRKKKNSNSYVRSLEALRYQRSK